MISLTLNYEPPFNEITKILSENIKFDKELSLKELLNFLKKQYGEEFYELLWDKKKKEEINYFLSIIINGHNFRDNNFLGTQLKDKDDLTFLYIYFGG
ncbi:MAG: MoaD/ThiS family protein [Candidatus Lokiarchaeota archaeon]|nr:MoaD/ThiS family protein [Candidatus Lokiarchaeota archaeon]